ncbi:MAG: LCP family protein [Candidatus Saccharimonadales bacterium]
MTKQRSNVDGFMPRRSASQLGEFHNPHQKPKINEPLSGHLQSSDKTVGAPVLVNEKRGVTRGDIDDSLRDIDGEVINETKRARRRRLKKGTPKSKTKRIIKWVIILILLGLVSIGGYLGYKVLSASGSVFKGSIFDLVQSQPLKQDTNGRTNILIVGTSEDDPGHEGGTLTDSIMIMSIDQTKKNVYLISVPRDLYVKYGQACNAGYAGKINEYYGCVKEGDSLDQQRAGLTKTGSFIGEIFGLDVQYGVNVNYTVMRQLVNAVGGITVTIESRDPRGQMDSNFDWKCGVGDRKVSRSEVLRRCPPSGHYIDYPNGPVNLDAEHALYLAQARGDIAPTYGFEQSNFDREKNQQKIVKAIRDKAINAGTLSDLGKVTGIIDALGSNLRTTFETKEIRTLVDLMKSIKDQDIQSISLIDGDAPLMTTGNAGGMSIVQPSAGLYDYSAIRAAVRKQLSSDAVTKEAANVEVLNGSGVPGTAQVEADALTAKGITVTVIGNAPEGTYGDIDVYMIATDKPATKARLEDLYKIKVKTTKPPVAVSADTDFVVIFGKSRSSN